VLSAFAIGCGSATQTGGEGGTGGGAGGPAGAGGARAGAGGSSSGGARAGAGGSSSGGAPAAGTGGAATAGAGGSSAAGTGGDAATACTGAGICGRGPTGIYCAQSNGSSALASWKQWTPSYNDAAGWKGQTSYWATIQFPDITGDGKADVCGRASDGISCAVATGTGGFGPATYWLSSFTNGGGWSAQPYYWATIQFPDVNGDGKADVCGRASDGFYCAVSTGVNGFGPVANWTSGQFTDAAGWNGHQGYWGTIQFPDLDGDGKADICGRAGGGIYCALSNGATAFGTPTYWQTSFSDASGWNDAPGYWGTIQFPDVNGDGKADVCGRGGAGVYCAISNGTNGFGPATVWATGFSDAEGWLTNQSSWGTIQFPDVSGDGKADVCGRGPAGLVCGISNGTSGFSALTMWTQAFSDAAGANADATSWGTIQYPDLDADGKADVCGRTAAGITCGLSNGAGAFATAAWLDEFSDVNGWKTDLSYGTTLQAPNLNVTGCATVTKNSTYVQPISRRLPPF
jgi:hypothetical protein